MTLQCGICCGITSDTVGVGTLVVFTLAKRAKRRLLIYNKK